MIMAAAQTTTTTTTTLACLLPPTTTTTKQLHSKIDRWMCNVMSLQGLPKVKPYVNKNHKKKKQKQQQQQHHYGLTIEMQREWCVGCFVCYHQSVCVCLFPSHNEFAVV